jgi:MFS family permease
MSTTAQPSRRPIYLILFAALAAAAGNGISLIAFPWLVLQHNGSAFDASIVAGAASLPLLFSTLIAGTAVDYLGRRRVSIISDALSATPVAAVPVLAIMFGHASITVGVLAVLAALGALFDPAGITGGNRCCPRPPRAPGGPWTAPTAFTKLFSTWPTSSAQGWAGC